METVHLHQVETSNGTKTIFEAPSTINSIKSNKCSMSILNIVMIDVSGSMSQDWDTIENSWNSLMSSTLNGTTKVFVFGEEVEFRRFGTQLKPEDFMNSMTNLTDAVKTIRLEIEHSRKSFIRVFLITDGHHNASPIEPIEEINQLHIPKGKTIEVFLLGVRSEFPVQYSISIRSLLHNGNSNIPSIFWAMSTDEIESRMHSIAECVKTGFVAITLSEPGHLCPEFPLYDTVHLGEFVLYHCHPTELANRLKLSYKNEEDNNVDVPSIFDIKNVTARFLLDRIFRQWNSIIIQNYNKKLPIPEGVFEFMTDLYQVQYNILKKEINENTTVKSIKSRLEKVSMKKDLKHLETEFATLMNKSKAIIKFDGEIQNELELANNILQTTVKSKYDMKNYKMKGHTLTDYEKDMDEFLTIYDQNLDKIMALPDPDPEECCNITFQSSILDFKDPQFKDLAKEDKFTLMKTLNLTGIPIFAPVKNLSQINPWGLCIKNILVTPYALVSQSVLEFSAEMGSGITDLENKGVKLQESDDNSRLNAIIPVFTEQKATVLKPLIRTNIFGMLATFCILKNPHIIDMNAHMAALSCALVKTICDFPKEIRPSFVNDRIQMIIATANVYLDRSSYKKYYETLCSTPEQALMTESKGEINSNPVKCETLIKAISFIYLNKNKNEMKSQLKPIFKLLCIEFIGRNLSKYNEETPYSNFFAPDISTKNLRKLWEEQQVKNSEHLLEQFISKRGKPLATFFKVEDFLKEVKAFIIAEFEQKQDSMFKIAVVTDKINKLYGPSSAGDLKFNALKIIADEIGLSKEEIEEIFSYKNVFTYVYHGLKYRNSSERLSAEVTDFEVAFKKVTALVLKENALQVKKKSLEAVLKQAEDIWCQEYLEAHKEVVRPMLKEEIIEKASERGVQVSLDNFPTVFRFNANSGLLRNACMVEMCPHFLIPNRSFNQHLWIERKSKEFSHLVHKVTQEVAFSNLGVEEVLTRLVEKEHVPSCGRKLPPPPDKKDLEGLKEQIEILLMQYKNISRTDKPDVTSEVI